MQADRCLGPNIPAKVEDRCPILMSLVLPNCACTADACVGCGLYLCSLQYQQFKQLCVVMQRPAPLLVMVPAEQQRNQRVLQCCILCLANSSSFCCPQCNRRWVFISTSVCGCCGMSSPACPHTAQATCMSCLQGICQIGMDGTVFTLIIRHSNHKACIVEHFSLSKL